MKTFQLHIVTPVGSVFDGPASYVSVPGREGSLGVLAEHSPLVTMLKAGDVLVRNGETEKTYAITSGILEINAGHQVLVLADKAEEIKK